MCSQIETALWQCSLQILKHQILFFNRTPPPTWHALPPKTSRNAMAILRCWPRLQWFSMDRIKGNLKHQAVSVISNTVIRTMGSGIAPHSWSNGHGFESLQEQWENFLLHGQLSVLTFIRSTPVLPRLHVKDPSHSAKSAGGRLQLNAHTPYICGFAWSNMVHGCMVYTECIKMAAISCGTSYASTVTDCKYTTLVDIQKRAIKSYSLMQNHMQAQWVCSRAENSAA